MTLSVVPTSTVKLPRELNAYFGDPPVVGQETLEDYNTFFVTIASAVNPPDVIGWIWTKDYVDICWDIRRERMVKAEIIKSAQREVVVDRLKSTFDKSDRLGSAMNRIFYAGEQGLQWAIDPEAREEIERKLAARGHDPSSLLAEAYMRVAPQIDAIDRRIAAGELRRNACLREIERRNDAMARKLEESSANVIDAEFTEAAE